MLDINKMKGNKTLEQDVDIQSMMEGENPNDGCSLQNIQISNTAEFISGTDTGNIDDEYDPGF